MNSPALPQVALIGIGGYGESHLSILNELTLAHELKLVAAADPFLDKYPQALSKLKSQNVRCYTDYEKLLNEESSIQLVVISTPIPLHDSMIRKVLEHDLYVYLEKPPVPTIQQLTELINLDTKNRITVGFQLMQLVHIQQLKQWMINGALGDIRQIIGTCGSPRGHTYYNRANWAGKLMLDDTPVYDGPSTNGCSHLIQLIMFLGGETEGRHGIPEWIEGEFYRARPIESYDLAGISGGFSSGSEFTTLIGHCCPTFCPYQLKVIGTRDTVTVQLNEHGSTMKSDCGLDTGLPSNDFRDCSIRLYREILKCIHHEREYPVQSLQDCVGYLKTACGGLISSGKIQSIGRQYISVTEAEAGLVYSLHGLKEMLEKTQHGHGLPSSQKAPWAIKGTRIQTSQITHMHLPDYIQKHARRLSP